MNYIMQLCNQLCDYTIEKKEQSASVLLLFRIPHRPQGGAFGTQTCHNQTQKNSDYGLQNSNNMDKFVRKYHMPLIGATAHHTP